MYVIKRSGETQLFNVEKKTSEVSSGIIDKENKNYPKVNGSYDLTGLQFRDLIVLERTTSTKRGSIQWKCICKCGNITSVTTGNLLKKQGTGSCGCHKYRKKDIVPEKTYGDLTVLHRVENNTTLNRSRASFLCRCKCGIEKAVTFSALRSGSTISCGCVKRSRASTATKEYWVNIRGSAETAALNRTLREYKAGARTRNLSWDITDVLAKKLFLENCAYCNLPPINIARHFSQEYRHNGIDRFDNTLGYVSGNVLACCSQCNRAKNKATRDEFLDWIIRILENLKDLNKETLIEKIKQKLHQEVEYEGN